MEFEKERIRFETERVAELRDLQVNVVLPDSNKTHREDPQPTS